MIRSLLIVFLLTASANAQIRPEFVARVFQTTPEAKYTSSGILIGRDLVLTNHHAIRGDGEITVELTDGTVLPAKIVKSTEIQDLALLQIAPVSMATVSFGTTPRVDQPVQIYGFARGTDYRESVGKVTGPARPAKTDRDTMFTTDAGVIKGMSGGPVLDSNLQLVGVLFGGDEKTSFCVSVATVREFLELLNRNQIRAQ